MNKIVGVDLSLISNYTLLSLDQDSYKNVLSLGSPFLTWCFTSSLIHLILLFLCDGILN